MFTLRQTKGSALTHEEMDNNLKLLSMLSVKNHLFSNNLPASIADLFSSDDFFQNITTNSSNLNSFYQDGCFVSMVSVTSGVEQIYNYVVPDTLESSFLEIVAFAVDDNGMFVIPYINYNGFTHVDTNNVHEVQFSNYSFSKLILCFKQSADFIFNLSRFE